MPSKELKKKALQIMAKFPEWKEIKKSLIKEGQQAEHLDYCGWCRQGLECPYHKEIVC